MPEVAVSAYAASIGVSVDTVRRRIRAGELPARRDARGYYTVIVPGDDAAVLLHDAVQHMHDVQQPVQHAVQAAAPADTVPAALYNEVAHQRDRLERELEREQAAAAELRRLLQQALQLRLVAPVDATAAPADPPNYARTADSAGVAHTDGGTLPRRHWWAFWQVRA